MALNAQVSGTLASYVTESAQAEAKHLLEATTLIVENLPDGLKDAIKAQGESLEYAAVVLAIAALNKVAVERV